MEAISDNGTHFLLNDAREIRRGGEGRILLVDELPGMVAKVYLPGRDCIEARQLTALQPLDTRFFVKPEQRIYEWQRTQKGAAIGFLMQYLDNDFFPLSALFGVQFCQKHGIAAAEKWHIAEQIKQGMEAAHAADIVIGDFSGLNILINSKLEVKFIDTDAYQTAAKQHSGLLLDEIRDYLYGGRIGRESDYFAYAVLLFQLLTYTHPFKGVHTVYKTLHERMMQRLPVFADDPRLTLPKCYQPIADTHLQTQFEDIFMKGHRFVISARPQSQPKAAPTMVVRPPTKGHLSVTVIWAAADAERIEDVQCTEKLAVIKTDRRYAVFELHSRGNFRLRFELPRTAADDLFVGQHHVLAKKDHALYIINDRSDFQLISNVRFNDDTRIKCLQNILVVIEKHLLRYLHIDEVNRDFIRIEQTIAFGQGIQIGGGLLQQAGGKQYTFYHSGTTLSTAATPTHFLDSFTVGDIGLGVYREQLNTQENKLCYHWWQVGKNAHIQLSTQETDRLKHFAVMPSAGGLLVFEPSDTGLLVRRTPDFSVIQQLDTDRLSDQSALWFSQAGILAWENHELLLLNKQ
jgi:serine/threonine protein kinase